MISKPSVMSSSTFFVEVFHGKASRRPPTSKSTRKLEKRSRQLPLLSLWKVIPVSFLLRNVVPKVYDCEDEFSIYLNYVRKLTFDETPDYDFLRGLFDLALSNSGEMDDGVYDWMMLNNGQGWEASGVSFIILAWPAPSLMLLPASVCCAGRDRSTQYTRSRQGVSRQG